MLIVTGKCGGCECNRNRIISLNSGQVAEVADETTAGEEK